MHGHGARGTGHGSSSVANLIELDADGVLHLDKQPSAALVHDAWQFICVVKGEGRADFYISGLHKASAAPAPPAPVTLAMGLLGTNWTGAVDDVWVLNRALEPYDVMRMFVNEGATANKRGARGLSEFERWNFNQRCGSACSGILRGGPDLRGEFTPTLPYPQDPWMQRF